MRAYTACVDLSDLAARLLDTGPMASARSGLFLLAADPQAQAWRLAELLQGRAELLLIEVDLSGVNDPARILELTIRVATTHDVPLGDLSIARALARLSDRVQVPIVLLISDVQRLLETARGRDLLFELKSARDELNLGPHHGLRIVAIGSDGAAVRSLVRAPDAAFYCAPLIEQVTD